MSTESGKSRGTGLEHVWLDARYALRTMRKDLGFAIFAILIVGLGVGASCTVFSVVDTLLIRPLPFREPGQLVWIANHDDATGDMSAKTTQVDFLLDYQKQNESFEDVAGYFAFYGTGGSLLTGNGEPERLTSVPVSQNFFPVLGVEPEIGRQFSAEECKWNGPKAVMLSHGLWERRFASDPKIVGTALAFDGGPATVVGVLPASFDFGTIFAPGSRIDIFEPFPLTQETNRWGNTLAIVGRLKPGVTLGKAQAEATILGKRFEQMHPRENEFDPKISALAEHVSGRLRATVIVLACAVGVVMLIVCANLSNLLLARSAARQKEIAIRAALGAGKRRLIGQLLVESFVLSCCGAAVGLLLAFGGTRVLSHLTSVSIPMLSDVRVNGSVLGFTVVLAVLTGLIFGLAPAMQIEELKLHDTLKDSNRGSSQGRGSALVRGALVVSEIALACVLLVGAGLLIRSFLRVLDVNLGFVPQRAAALQIDPNSSYKTEEQRNEYFNEALRRVKEVPGIEAAGLSDFLPLGHNRSWGIAAKGAVYAPGDYPGGFPRIVSDGYFRSMGIPMIEGRDFTERDSKDALPVIIVNETLAKNLWPGEDAIGKILLADHPERTVVGVVGDVHHISPEEPSGNEFYIPIRQTQDYGSVDLVMRTSLPTAELAARVREALRPIEPDLPTANLRTLQTLVDRAVSPRRFVVILLGGFAGFALILASLGIYAVISYSVSQRTQEIGIRMALGASAERLQKSILLQTMGLAGIGVAIGIVASWMLARAMSGLLFGVTANDPVTFAGMLVVLTIVAAMAGWLPARRASRIDPMAALRIS
ncbi:MAG TPA: ABC transporter permease [Candidatus Acidoferrum sp.]|nr:ABC transporter permease [Candidatus Acidoferrum sp.]